jgi:hypothetical protein
VPAFFTDCLPVPPRPGEPDGAVTEVKPRVDTCFAQLAAAGYKQKLVFQPADRFWTLQWAETGVFLALSGLLTWFSFWWVRRRLA